MDVRKRIIVCAAAIAGTALAGSGTALALSEGGHAARPAVAAVKRHQPSSGVTAAYDWAQFGGGVVPHSQLEPNGDTTSAALGVGPTRQTPQLVQGLGGKTIVQIATSNSDDYALTSSGAVYAWGAGAQGELGNGKRPTVSNVAVKVKLPANIKIASLPNPMPYNGGMAIATNHTVWAWGNDLNQQFCRQAKSTIATPIKVRLKDVRLAVGARSHATYYASGRFVSCGSGPDGQLGDGASGASAQTGTPKPVLGLPRTRPVALTAGWGNTGVLMADGNYYDWGFNADGQVGNGTTTTATTAVKVTLPDPVVKVSLGGSFSNNGQTMAILGNGSVWEWGDGQAGQLATGLLKNVLAPIPVPTPAGVHFVFVNSGGSTDYAIDRSGDLWSAGSNWDYQLGAVSTVLKQPTWVKVPLKHVVAVSSTAHNAFALTSSGS